MSRASVLGFADLLLGHKALASGRLTQANAGNIQPAAPEPRQGIVHRDIKTGAVVSRAAPRRHPSIVYDFDRLWEPRLPEAAG